MIRWLLAISLSKVALVHSFAGGSGLNVAVVVNERSTNSIDLGNYYAERRHVPPQNVVGIDWPGSNVSWTLDEFTNRLFSPLTNALTQRHIQGQIDYVVLSMDIPYKVTSSNGVNSTTSTLFYGFKADPAGAAPPTSCSLPPLSVNLYAQTEQIFRKTPPGTNANGFLTMMLTASNLAEAKRIVDQGVDSDGSFPTQSVLLVKSTDPARNIRHTEFADAVFNSRVIGNSNVFSANEDPMPAATNLLGWQNGQWRFSVATTMFAPGAMADNLTSFGGVLFAPNDQSTLLDLLAAGASGSYGTVIEPCAYLDKFPRPQNYFYQGRGFNLAECYYQSIKNPYQGLLVGEPLAAPYAKRGSGRWLNLPRGSVLSGIANLSLDFTAADGTRPLQQVDLFVDGVRLTTLTNISPTPGEVVQAALDRTLLDYTVQPGDSISDIATGLAAAINAPSNSPGLMVWAVPHGDRIELQALDSSRLGRDMPNKARTLASPAPGRTVHVNANGSTFLDTVAFGMRDVNISGPILGADYLRMDIVKTNGVPISIAITNSSTNMTVAGFTSNFFNAINLEPGLQGGDGFYAEDFSSRVVNPANGWARSEFTLRTRNAGLAASAIKVRVTGSFNIVPSLQQALDQNIKDLRPRHHYYITAGLTSLPVEAELDTTLFSDGWHTLTAVAYEGSHVRTQTLVEQEVRFQNSLLTASMSTLIGGSNTAVESSVLLQVNSNQGDVSKIELMSNGGPVQTVTGGTPAYFFLQGSSLRLGLHPLYALVTTSDGLQYRTETKWVRIVGLDQPFSARMSGSPLSVVWPAVAGRNYDILRANSPNGPFFLRASVVSFVDLDMHWVESAAAPMKGFYRIRATP